MNKDMKGTMKYLKKILSEKGFDITDEAFEEMEVIIYNYIDLFAKECVEHLHHTDKKTIKGDLVDFVVDYGGDFFTGKKTHNLAYEKSYEEIMKNKA